jgi:hypothetical protein
MRIFSLLQHIHLNRKIEGISTVLLPFHPKGEIDLDGFTSHVQRTYQARLTPAATMDIGYVQPDLSSGARPNPWDRPGPLYREKSTGKKAPLDQLYSRGAAPDGVYRGGW